jgi:thioredoxin 1
MVVGIRLANKIRGVPLNFCRAAHNIDSVFYFSAMLFLDTISAVFAMMWRNDHAIATRSFQLAWFLPKNISPRVSREEYMSEHIHHVTDATFEQEVQQSSVPVLVDYWADWCGPCKMIAPILDEIAQEYAGRLKVAKLNIDENQGTPPKYGIRGIPTLMIFKNGNVEATKVGALSKSQLTAFIDSHI